MGEKKLEQQIIEMRAHIEQTIQNGQRFLEEIAAFQQKIKRQIDRNKRK